MSNSQPQQATPHRRPKASSDISPALQAANERLLRLRAQIAKQRAAPPPQPPTTSPVQTNPPTDNRLALPPVAHPPPATNQPPATGQLLATDQPPSPPPPPQTPPEHPAEDTPTVTAAGRICQAADQHPTTSPIQASPPADTRPALPLAAHQPPATDQPPPTSQPPIPHHPPATSQPQATGQPPATSLPDPSDRITFSPALALALLRQERVAEGRLWLLLRALDKSGRGWVAKKTAVACLTNPESPLYLCSERYLRVLLARGEGLLWTWQQGENGRIWLRSERKVAAGLKVKLGRTVVSLPIAELLQPLGQVRAHFYASFHAGRDKDDNDKSGKPPQPPAPISRATLTDLTGASRRTQYRYEQQTGIRVKANVAVGCALRETNRGEIEEQAWQYGPAWFAFTDKKGLIGPQGGRYQARQMPNSYHLSPTATSVRRLAQRKRRRPLSHRPHPQPASPTDLRHIGDAGNSRAVKAGLWAQVAAVRRYFANGAAAAKAWRDRQAVGYWLDRRAGVWFPLPGLAL